MLIIGSCLTYHNMSGFGRAGAMQVSGMFDEYFKDAITDPDPEARTSKLINWETAPAARLAHPREDHLIPLMVVAGAAGIDVGHRVFVDKVMNVAMASYRFGN